MSVERIVSAAIEIIDRDGLHGLSMRTLAIELDTGTATLYRYVRSKEEVLVEALDAVLGEIQLPEGFSPTSSWRSQAASLANALRDGLLAHPNVTPLLAGSVPIGPNALMGREAMLAVLLAAGFEPPLAARTYLAIVHYVIGFVLAENPESSAYRTNQKSSLKRYYQRLAPGRFPRIVALADELTARDNDREFAFGLDLILDGIERRSRTPGKRRRGRGG
jgi:AcrR family transcriptional regulator